MRAAIVAALLLGASACVTPPRGWYDICWEQGSRHNCIVSNAICPPYDRTQYILSGTTGIKPSEDVPLVVLMDTRDWRSAAVCFENLASFVDCWEKVNSSSTWDMPIYTHNFQNTVSHLSHFTIQPYPGTTANIALSEANVRDASMAQHPLCRVFEFSGYNIRLRGLSIDVKKCLSYFSAPHQYTPDDGAIIAFTGDSVGNLLIENVAIIAGTPSLVVTTGIRIADLNQNAVDATNAVIHSLVVDEVNNPIACFSCTKGLTIDLSKAQCDPGKDAPHCPIIFTSNDLKIVNITAGWVAVNVSASMPSQSTTLLGLFGDLVDPDPTTPGDGVWHHIIVALALVTVFSVAIAIIAVSVHGHKTIKHERTILEHRMKNAQKVE
jgi:hypothetical protein